MSSKKVFKNMLVVMTGSIAAKFIGLLSIPIITRLYSPIEMGKLSIFIAVISLMLPFSTFKYSISIPSIQSRRQALNMCALCGCILMLSLLFCVLLLALGYYFFNGSTLIYFEVIYEYVLLVPICLIGFGLYEIYESWAVRDEKFKVISFARFSQSLVGNLTKVFTGFITKSYLGLFLGHSLTLFAGVFVILFVFPTKEFYKTIDRQVIKFLLIKFSTYPKFRLPSQFLLIFSVQLPLLYFGLVFDTYYVGQLGLALTCIALPIALVGQSAGQAYYSEVAKIGVGGIFEIKKLTIEISKRLLLLSIIPALILFYFGEQVFIFSFGDDWRLAGNYVELLSLFLIPQFLSTPIVNVLNVLNKQKVFLFINLQRVILILFVLLISTFLGLDEKNCVLFYSITMFAHYFFTYAYIVKIIDIYSKRKMKDGSI